MSIKQIFCFTYAGGNSSFFDVIEKDLYGFELVKPEYSGHGSRHKEPFYKNFSELSDDMFEKIKSQYSGGEYALFGYSMGSITAVQVLEKIINDGKMPKPDRIFLAAHEPHTKSELQNFSPDELDEWVKKRTVQFGAVPDELLNNKTFWRMYLPIYRADYSIIAKYDFKKFNLKTDIPAVIFYSETDTPLKEMKLWEKYFTGGCEYFEFSGTHFFIAQHHEEMAKIMRKKLS